MTEQRASYGWGSGFPEFRSADAARVRERLEAFIADASPSQMRAWAESIPPLQREVDEVLVRDSLAASYSAILEYELPMESRRPDVLLLVGAGVMVLELKGKLDFSQADIDQAAAYARDLRSYHRECAGREVVPVLVPTRARGYVAFQDGVHVAGPDHLDNLVRDLTVQRPGAPIDREKFLNANAYCPLPTLVGAARELIRSGNLRTIDRASAATDPAVDEISRIIHQAALTKSRHLILVTGVPGAGKTLVGLRTVHAHYLDDLSTPRDGAKPTAPAVFLSGNGPLVEVLQYELRSAGGDGKTFVRAVRDYVKRYSARPERVPPEHVLVFDEAQRAWDAAKMADSHGEHSVRSEPEEFIGFAERVPEWCVVLGLIGSGQEIYIGEEGGVRQWFDAVEAARRPDEWTVHAPPAVAEQFSARPLEIESRAALNLDSELRFHGADDLHRFVAGALAAQPRALLAATGAKLAAADYHLRITRSLEAAKEYLRSRYADNPNARFGLVASSRDNDLPRFGIPNDWLSTTRVKHGPWYGDAEDDNAGRSCRRLEACVTEFGAQGLELDATLLAWGTDLVLNNGEWSIAKSRAFRSKAVRNPMQLRLNAYRVLLTRGRDACVVFVPPLPELDETFEFLISVGFKSLSDDGGHRESPRPGNSGEDRVIGPRNSE
jgi:hypothetical protein